MHLGSPPYMTADILLTVAMLFIGWSVRHEFISRLSEFADRARSMVGNNAVSHCGRLDYSESFNVGEENKALSASKVRAHG